MDRKIEQAKALMQVQQFLVGELKKNTENVNNEIDNFKREAQAWMARQIVKVNLKIIMNRHFFRIGNSFIHRQMMGLRKVFIYKSFIVQ